MTPAWTSLDSLLDEAMVEWSRAIEESPTIAIRNRRAATILRRLAERVEKAGLGPCAFPGCPPGEDWPHKPCDHREPHEPRAACHEHQSRETTR